MSVAEIFVLLKFFLGFILLIKGSDYLINYAVFFASRFNLSPMLVGFTLVSIGTSLPELVVSVFSNISVSQREASRFVFSAVLGSNIANTTLILGVSLLFGAITLPKSFLKRDFFFTIIGTVLFCLVVFSWYDLPLQTMLGGEEFFSWLKYQSWSSVSLSRISASIFLVMFFSYLFFLFYSGRLSEKEFEEHKATIQGNKYSFVWLMVSILAIGYGADWIVSSVIFISTNMLSIDEKIVVASVVAFGTSLPELMTSISAARKKEHSILLGNIMGSNLFNMFVITSFPALIRPLYTEDTRFMESFAVDGGFFLLYLLILLVVCVIARGVLFRKTAVILLVLYFCYLFFIFKSA